MKRVGIVGSGLGALSSAAYLATNGFKVKIFEKNGKPGGKLNKRVLGDYRFDIGPSLLTMPFVVKDLLNTLNAEDKIEFEKIDPICRYYYPDGTKVDAWHDIEKFKMEIAQFSKKDSEQIENFLNYSKQIYDLTSDIFLYTPFQEIKKILKLKNFKTLFSLPKIDSNRTMHEAICSYFEDERIIQLFGRYATYNGSSPYQAPATLNIIPHVEYTLGSYYIKGGMYKLAEVLHESLQNYGVDFEFNSKVLEIINNGKNVKGIRTKNGTEEFDHIISNADVAHTYQELIKNKPKEIEKIEKLEPSLSGYIMLLGVKKVNKELNHHNIFFSKDYEKEFKDIFIKKTIPSDPTIYVAITSKSDPNHAPNGAENWFILLNMPYLQKFQNWNEQKYELRNTVLRKLKDSGFDIEDSIEEEQLITPEDLFDLYLSNKGSIYGTSSNSKFSAFMRPRNRSKALKGLYFANGSAHPGGGIPLVILSGKHAADLIIEENN